MQDLMSLVRGLSRPRLLVRAARFGVSDYARGRALPRLLRVPAAPAAGPALIHLLALEREAEERRRARAADYSAARHVELLTAIMGEARRLRDAGPAPVS